MSLRRKWNWVKKNGGLRCEMSSSSTHPPHSWDIKGYGGVYVCVSICLCVVEALKWDHRLNQAKALDTHPPLINSPIRKHPHWQKHRWRPIDGCVIRRAGFRSIKKETCSTNMTQTNTARGALNNTRRTQANQCSLWTIYMLLNNIKHKELFTE